MDLTESIKQKALELGFDLVGITTAEPVDVNHIEYFNMWLSSGRSGQMDYLHKNFGKRTCPAKLLDGARSVICTGLNFKPSIDEQERSPASDVPVGRIANYALYEDYHVFIKDMLFELAAFIKEVSGKKDFKIKVCVDSAPLAERSLAQRAGLGFIGKNHMLINPNLGLQFFLGEIVTNLELKADAPGKGRCSGCDKCIKACPSGALGFDGSFDASKCISYLTTESEGAIPKALAPKIEQKLFGCDQCLRACPYDSKAPPCRNSRFKFFPDRRYMDLELVKKWDRASFEHYYANSVIERLGIERLKRNARVCLENYRNNHGARNTSYSSRGTSRPE